MMEQRTFASLAVTGLASASGVGVLATANGGSDPNVILELLNEAGVHAKMGASISAVGDDSGHSRQERILAGEREHCHFERSGENPYEIRGCATVSLEDPTVEFGGESAEISGGTLEQVPANRETSLRDGDRVVVRLATEDDIGIEIE